MQCVFEKFKEKATQSLFLISNIMIQKKLQNPHYNSKKIELEKRMVYLNDNPRLLSAD
jgi:hypothetical protein